MGLVWINAVTTQILPLHVMSLILFIWALRSSYELDRKVMVSILIMLSPFVLALIYNYFYFSPVEVYELQGSEREKGLTAVRTSLNMSNVTQFIYLLFALILYWIYSSIELNRQALKRTLDVTIFFVCSVGVIQIITWFTNTYFIYKELFYVLDIGSLNQTFMFGLKRVNSTFPEPSYFGLYSIYTLIFYLLYFGKNAFIECYAVRFLFVMGFLSTSTAFLWGFCYLGLLYYLFYTDRSSKVLLYLLLILALGIILYTGSAELMIQGKETSINIRWHYGWVQAWKNIFESPIFGLAYGTDRPLMLTTQMVSAIGFLGVIIFLYGLLYLSPLSWQKKMFLWGIVWIGSGIFELTRPELWVYLGLLTHQNFAMNNYIGIVRRNYSDTCSTDQKNDINTVMKTDCR
jgi:hypothetical protein